MFCAYCLQPFSAKRYDQATCGNALCKSRTTSWNSWLNRSRLECVRGDVNKPAKRASKLPAVSAKDAALLDHNYREGN